MEWAVWCTVISRMKGSDEFGNTSKNVPEWAHSPCDAHNRRGAARLRVLVPWPLLSTLQAAAPCGSRVAQGSLPPSLLMTCLNLWRRAVRHAGTSPFCICSCDYLIIFENDSLVAVYLSVSPVGGGIHLVWFNIVFLVPDIRNEGNHSGKRT